MPVGSPVSNRRSLDQDDIDEGNLVKAIDETVTTDSAYYLVYPQSSQQNPKAEIFKAWVLGEI